MLRAANAEAIFDKNHNCHATVNKQMHILVIMYFKHAMFIRILQNHLTLEQCTSDTEIYFYLCFDFLLQKHPLKIRQDTD